MVSLLNRETGEVHSHVVANVTAATVSGVLRENVHRASTLMTDESSAYRPIGQTFVGHHAVNHERKEYARDGWITTNTLEGYFGQLKRSLTGTFHHVSREHLQRYMHEFDLRYSTRHQADGVRMTKVIQQTGGRRLTYRDPTGT